jgi:hypothetical protein
MKFARYTFLIAGIYGLLVMPVCYLLEQTISRDHPPAITHPEFFYGFIGIATAFQFVFLIIGSDPVRYRLMILPSIVEKFSYGIAALVLWNSGRLEGGFFYGGMIDLFLGLLFVVSYIKLLGGRSK